MDYANSHIRLAFTANVKEAVKKSSYCSQCSGSLNASDGSKCLAWLLRLSITYKVANTKVFRF